MVYCLKTKGSTVEEDLLLAKNLLFQNDPSLLYYMYIILEMLTRWMQPNSIFFSTPRFRNLCRLQFSIKSTLEELPFPNKKLGLILPDYLSVYIRL